MADRARWERAVAARHAVSSEIDSSDPLAAPAFLGLVNRAIEELEDARDELRVAGDRVSSVEWAEAYALHHRALARWNQRVALARAVRDSERQRQDACALYARIVRDRAFL